MFVSSLSNLDMLIIVKMFTKVNSKHFYYAKLCTYMKGEFCDMYTYLDKLRGLREDNDLTQQQVATVLGTSQTMYARYERGANELPIRHLIALCRFYNVSADYLLNTDPDPRRKQKRANVK